jgi:hypothetical protein
VPLINRQRSLTEAILISLVQQAGSQRCYVAEEPTPRSNIICCTVSVSFLQNLQVASKSNSPIIYRCSLTGACPVKIATFSAALQRVSWFAARFSRGYVKDTSPMCHSPPQHELRQATHNTVGVKHVFITTWFPKINPKHTPPFQQTGDLAPTLPRPYPTGKPHMFVRGQFNK